MPVLGSVISGRPLITGTSRASKSQIRHLWGPNFFDRKRTGRPVFAPTLQATATTETYPRLTTLLDRFHLIPLFSGKRGRSADIN